MFVFVRSFTSVLAEKSSSELGFHEKEIPIANKQIVLKSRISSQTWDCDVLG